MTWSDIFKYICVCVCVCTHICIFLTLRLLMNFICWWWWLLHLKLIKFLSLQDWYNGNYWLWRACVRWVKCWVVDDYICIYVWVVYCDKPYTCYYGDNLWNITIHLLLLWWESIGMSCLSWLILLWLVLIMVGTFRNVKEWFLTWMLWFRMIREHIDLWFRMWEKILYRPICLLTHNLYFWKNFSLCSFGATSVLNWGWIHVCVSYHNLHTFMQNICGYVPRGSTPSCIIRENWVKNFKG